MQFAFDEMLGEDLPREGFVIENPSRGELTFGRSVGRSNAPPPPLPAEAGQRCFAIEAIASATLARIICSREKQSTRKGRKRFSSPIERSSVGFP